VIEILFDYPRFTRTSIAALDLHAFVDFAHRDVELDRRETDDIASSALDTFPADVTASAMNVHMRSVLTDQNVFDQPRQRAIRNQLLAAVRTFRACGKHLDDEHRIVELSRAHVELLFAVHALTGGPSLSSRRS